MIYLSINYTDEQKSPTVLPVCWGPASKRLFSQRLCSGFSWTISYRFFFFLFPLEAHICCCVQEIPTVLGFPQLQLERHQSAQGSLGLRSQQVRQAADARCFFLLLLWLILFLNSKLVSGLWSHWQFGEWMCYWPLLYNKERKSQKSKVLLMTSGFKSHKHM